MPQCFFETQTASVFEVGGVPDVLYACSVQGETARLPRTLHQHEALAELVLVCAGRAVHRIGGKTYHTGEGDLICYNSGELHDEAPRDGDMQQSYCVGIRNLHFKGLPRHHLLSGTCCPVIPCGRYFEAFRELFAQIYAQAACGAPESGETAAYLLRALLAQMPGLVRAQAAPPETEDCALSERVRAYLDAHYCEAITLAQVAAAVRANPYYLSHAFKAVSGYAPMQYVTRRRIGEAQNLLINTQESVTEIAARVGYENSNYFQNVFRAMVGMPPGRYRKQWREKPLKPEM